MEQVFVNLLNNRSGHNPPGTHVRVTAEAGPAEVVVSVLDDGLGLPSELAVAPFEPARRLAPATAHATAPAPPTATAPAHRKSAGAGLGPVHRQGHRPGPTAVRLGAGRAAQGHLLQREPAGTRARWLEAVRPTPAPAPAPTPHTGNGGES